MPLIDITEAAARLGIAPKTLYKWVESGQVPHIRIGRLVRFREEDLERWMDGQAYQPKPTASPKDGHASES